MHGPFITCLVIHRVLLVSTLAVTRKVYEHPGSLTAIWRQALTTATEDLINHFPRNCCQLNAVTNHLDASALEPNLVYGISRGSD